MNQNYKDAWDYKEVTVAGWGYTDTLEEGEWYHDPDVKAGEGAQFLFHFHTINENKIRHDFNFYS